MTRINALTLILSVVFWLGVPVTPAAAHAPPSEALSGCCDVGMRLDASATAWLAWESPGTDAGGCLMFWYEADSLLIVCDDGTELGGRG